MSHHSVRWRREGEGGGGKEREREGRRGRGREGEGGGGKERERERGEGGGGGCPLTSVTAMVFLDSKPPDNASRLISDSAMIPEW